MTKDEVCKFLERAYHIRIGGLWYNLIGHSEWRCKCYLEECESGKELCMSLEELAAEEDVAFYELRKLTKKDIKGEDK